MLKLDKHPYRHLLPMARLLQEMANRWCHQSVCVVLTIDVYANVNPLKGTRRQNT